MKPLFFLSLLFLVGVGGFAQKQNNIWYFGWFAGWQRRMPITPLWSNALQDYHAKYLINLSTAEKRAAGCMW